MNANELLVKCRRIYQCSNQFRVGFGVARLKLLVNFTNRSAHPGHSLVHRIRSRFINVRHEVPLKELHSDSGHSSGVIEWLAACLAALLLSSVYLLDGPSELEAAQAVSADVQDAIVTAKADHDAR